MVLCVRNSLSLRRLLFSCVFFRSVFGKRETRGTLKTEHKIGCRVKRLPECFAEGNAVEFLKLIVFVLKAPCVILQSCAIFLNLCVLCQ